MSSQNLHDFCEDFFKVLGCLVEAGPDASREVLLPDELSPFFNNATYLKVSFSPEATAKDASIELLAYGSPTLIGIIAAATHAGRTAREYATGLPLKKGDITARIINDFHLRSDKVSFSQSFPAMTGSLLLYYRLSFLADEKRDFFHRVAVDLASGALNNDIFDNHSLLFPDEEPDVNAPSHIRQSAVEAHEHACHFLSDIAARTLDRLTMRTEKKKVREIERVNTFFDQSNKELKQRLHKCAPDSSRRAGLIKKLEAIKADRRRKLIDVRKKYTYRIKGECVAARLLMQPKIYYPFEISFPYVTVKDHFAWDPALKRIDSPACHVCHLRVQGITACANGHIVCASCSLQCPRCKRIWCVRCGTARCAACGREFCPDCVVECDRCGSTLCRRHRDLCRHESPSPHQKPAETPAPRIEFGAGTRELLEKIEKKEFAPPERFSLALRAHNLSLIEGFDTLLCLDMVCHVEHFDYQIETARKTLRDFAGRALLCDEVGLGKTIEAGLVLKEYILRGLVRRTLILVPPSLIEQWHGELWDKFGLDFTTTDDPAFARDSHAFWTSTQMIIASLHTAKRKPHATAIAQQHFDLVIVDEAHHLKNRRTQSWKFVNSLNKRFILLLTATPVQNNLEELFNLITLLKPGQLSTYRQFKQEFGVRGEKLAVRNSEKLRERLVEVMIRNSRSEVSITLPPRRAETQHIELFPEELALYRETTDFVRRFQPVVLSEKRGLTHFTLQLLQMEAGSSSFALRQTVEKMLDNPANYPDAVPALRKLLIMINNAKRSAKAEALRAWLGPGDEHAIIFTHFRGTQRFLATMLKNDGMTVWNYHGGLNTAQKEEVIAGFQRTGGVLVSTEVGGEGKNFQFCQRLVNYDLPWNPMRIEQRIGRIHRIGQEKPVNILNFSARGTIESHILTILDEKINMFELVIGEMDMILGNLDEEREFENIVMEIWTGATDDEDAAQKFDRLGEDLLAAKKRYLTQKKLDEALFGADYSS